MSPREVVRAAISGRRPPYVPWDMGFTQEARDKLVGHYGTRDLDPILRNHILTLSAATQWTDLGGGRTRDPFGVVWDRSVDRDIGQVSGCVLPEPTLEGYDFPDHSDPRFFAHIPAAFGRTPDRFRVFSIGFSLYERAWTLRGMENLMTDFCLYPDFARALLTRIGDYNIALVRRALEYDFDAVHFGDDWGSQLGLQMGSGLWHEFIYPVLKRTYAEVRSGGKMVTIHSCGKVDELFDDLVGIGLNCFNPFQPEVMDVWSLLPKYRGRLAFHGGLSTQKTLPYGTPDDVRAETRRLLALGRDGGYVFAPAHAVEGDVPVENMTAFIDEVQRQPGAGPS